MDNNFKELRDLLKDEFYSRNDYLETIQKILTEGIYLIYDNYYDLSKGDSTEFSAYQLLKEHRDLSFILYEFKNIENFKLKVDIFEKGRDVRSSVIDDVKMKTLFFENFEKSFGSTRSVVKIQQISPLFIKEDIITQKAFFLTKRDFKSRLFALIKACLFQKQRQRKKVCFKKWSNKKNEEQVVSFLNELGMRLPIVMNDMIDYRTMQEFDAEFKKQEIGLYFNDLAIWKEIVKHFYEVNDGLGLNVKRFFKDGFNKIKVNSENNVVIANDQRHKNLNKLKSYQKEIKL